MTSQVFKKPSVSEFRSYQANASFTTTANASFSSQQMQPIITDSFQSTSVNTSFNTTSSSQNQFVNTADTSFASNVDDAQVKYPKLPRISSTSSILLSDQDLSGTQAAVEAQLLGELEASEERNHSSQEHPRGSSSTYGSLDERGMLERSIEVENGEDPDFPAPPARQSLTRVSRSTHQAKTRTGSARKTQLPQSPTAEHSPFNLPPGHSSNDKRIPRASRISSDISTARASAPSPSKPLKESPSKLPHYIRDIPGQNLFTQPWTQDLEAYPYFVLFFCSGIASEHHVSLSTVLRGVGPTDALHTPSKFLEQISWNLGMPNNTFNDQQKYLSAWKRNFEGFTFKARLDFNKPSPGKYGIPRRYPYEVILTLRGGGPTQRYVHPIANSRPVNSCKDVFKLTVLPIQTEKSCRLQRKFGSDRFLYVNVPSFDPGENKPSRFINEDMKNIAEQWKLWTEREHLFLGRKWKVIHLERIRKKKALKALSVEDASDKRIVLFAFEGTDIEKPISIGNMLDWFFPFKNNMDQAHCKAFARLDLGLSRTIPTLTFKPSQIRPIKDKIADGTPEATRFNDTSIDAWPSEYPTGKVMDDGCALISVGAALKIWQTVRKVTNNTTEPMPRAFQARIGGAKGVWMVSADSRFGNADDNELWIQISESQLKFKPHWEDLSDESEWDAQRLTFEYLNHSRCPVSSELHISFIPILSDRGVPRHVIADLMVDHLDAERRELLETLTATERMYHWIHKEGPSNVGNEYPPWHGGMHRSLPEQIKHLIESGFVPEEEPFLADCICRFIQTRQLRMESKLRVPLHKSTFVLGVADPYGILEPGEVHMEFSTPFTDELTGAWLRSLEGMDILVSRQPACRRSDIQRVRAVRCAALSHLVDVVVFPTKGQYPLAGKLQGGDYDGDTFWLCWDQALVEPFKNAPAPIDIPDPAEYGIEQDTRELSAVMDPNDLSTVDNFLREALRFRMEPSLLGIVSNHLEKQAYYENRVFSDRLDALCDMHDYLVDAPKQGYKFSDRDFKDYTINVLRCGNPREPAYKEAMKDCEKRERDDIDKKTQSYKHKKENILDYLYFEVIRKHDVATLEKVKTFFSKKFGEDPDPVLQYPYLHLREHGSDEVKKELDALVKSLKIVGRNWLDIIMADEKEKKSDWYSTAVATCYAKYRAILPLQVDHPDIRPWLSPYLRPEYSLWEVIRASAFYAEYPNRHKLVWTVAGKQLAELKAASHPGSTMCVPKIKAIMRPRAIKAPRPEDDESEDEFQDALEEL